MRHGLTSKKAEQARGAPPEEQPLAQALARFEGFLSQRALRLTAARRAIVEAVLGRDGHFPIEELVADLRKRGIRGSKATVYRTLPLLTEAGILQQAVFTGDTRNYEAAVGREHHDHLVCRACGKVVEFEFDAIEILQREIAARHGFRPEAHYHQIVGTCADCQRAEKEASARPGGRHGASRAGERAGTEDET